MIPQHCKNKVKLKFHITTYNFHVINDTSLRHLSERYVSAKLEGYGIPLFITALFMTGKTWDQAACSLTDDRTCKMLCKYSMGYYSEMKKNALSRKTNLEEIMLSELSQGVGDRYQMASIICKI